VVSAAAGTLVFFETPHRIQSSLRDAGQYLGDRPLVVGRELTKLHQEFLRGTAAELADRLTQPKGEFTVVVGPPADRPADARELPESMDLSDEFRQLTETGGFSRREAISQLARKYDRPSREVYARLEEAKNSHS
jgi:16S rRNA (cytidine1402-2'-O)-methyltransferase